MILPQGWHNEYTAFMKTLPELPPKYRWEIVCTVSHENAEIKAIVGWSATKKLTSMFQYDERSAHEQDTSEPPQDAGSIEPPVCRHDD